MPIPLIHLVAWTPDPAVVSILLQAGADVHARDDSEWSNFTTLHVAARNGTPGIVRALLEAGADANAVASTRIRCPIPCGRSWTPLHLAAANPDPGVISALLEAGADLDAAMERATTPLHDAARMNSNPEVLRLLLEAGADVNARDGRGHTPLHEAAANNPNPEIATALIGAGAEVDARDPDDYILPYGLRPNDRTPLFMASSGVARPPEWNAAVVEVLVRAGADMEQADRSGHTPLHAAARSHPAVFPLLMRLGADPNARDTDGKTPMDYALENRSLEGLEVVRRMREEMRTGGASGGLRSAR